MYSRRRLFSTGKTIHDGNKTLCRILSRRIANSDDLNGQLTLIYRSKRGWERLWWNVTSCWIWKILQHKLSKVSIVQGRVDNIWIRLPSPLKSTESYKTPDSDIRLYLINRSSNAQKVGMRYVPEISDLIHMRDANLERPEIAHHGVRHVLRSVRIALEYLLWSIPISLFKIDVLLGQSFVPFYLVWSFPTLSVQRNSHRKSQESFLRERAHYRWPNIPTFAITIFWAVRRFSAYNEPHVMLSIKIRRCSP